MAAPLGESTELVCIDCGSPADVFVREQLFCAHCALTYHLDALQGIVGEGDEDREVERIEPR